MNYPENFSFQLKSLVIVTYLHLQHLTIKIKKTFMNIERIISTIKKKKYLMINETELNELLSHSKMIIEENTYISDKIRLLEFDDYLIIQEKTTKNEYLIRNVKTKKEAEELINERLDIYNRMWDGCGCKVNYYD